MATTEDKGRLTPSQIVRLASAISADNVESIAIGYLNIRKEIVKISIVGESRESRGIQQGNPSALDQYEWRIQ